MNRAASLCFILAQAGALVATRTAAQTPDPSRPPAPTGASSPGIEARVKQLPTVGGLTFKDLNGDGRLDS